MSHIAKVFRSGNSQAVRLPMGFHFDVDEVEVSREGDAVVLRASTVAHPSWSSLHAAVERSFSGDFMAEAAKKAGRRNAGGQTAS
ncbi:MAG: AbrB/MazE/SpoVT family DNA-binding domain-containing protein [Rhizobiales bacterium]|nr:AbrB/MazE/SpoVT family DNA-binding domain-containing protein [Hyphomicrobiales bacterium]